MLEGILTGDPAVDDTEIARRRKLALPKGLVLGEGGWRIYPPRPGVCFRAGKLANAVAMAQRDEERRAED